MISISTMVSDRWRLRCVGVALAAGLTRMLTTSPSWQYHRIAQTNRSTNHPQRPFCLLHLPLLSYLAPLFKLCPLRLAISRCCWLMGPLAGEGDVTSIPVSRLPCPHPDDPN